MSKKIAKELWEARVKGSRVDTATLELPADEQAAFAQQAELTLVSGATVVGFKIGATSQAALDLVGLEQPFFGPLFDPYFRENGEAVPAFQGHNVLLESEIVIGLGEDLPARDKAYTREQVREATAWISPGFELCAARFDVEPPGNGLLLIADSGINMDFVLGDKTTAFQDIDLSEHPVVLSVNGREAACGHSGTSIWGDPLKAVSWLAGHFALRDRGLKAGDVVTTGTCTGMTPVVIGDEATADFGVLGKVTTHLVKA